MCVDLVRRHPENYIKIHIFLSPSAPNIQEKKLITTSQCHIWGHKKGR
jgi:hypothetical protein